METDKTPSSLENEPVHKSLLNQKGNFLLILGAVVILVVLVAGGYLLAMNKNRNSNQYTPQPTPLNETVNWKIYSSECDFQISSPPAWKTKKFFFEDTPDSCTFITAPDYKEFQPHGREGFYIEITRIQKGSTIGNQIIQSLNDYISIENNITGSFLEVKNKKDKVIGKLIGKEFEPIGAEFQTKFIFEEGQYVYSVIWPGEYIEEYKSGYKGTYNKELDSIINSINFK